MKTTHFYLLRHGELTNTDVLAGHSDIPIAEHGMQQMRTSTYGLDIHRCISSPLKRCAVFAKELSTNLSVELNFEPLIKEMNFGDWDGKAFVDLWAMDKPNIGDFWQQPDKVSPPNGESFSAFSIRVEDWWSSLVAEHKDENVLVVTHAGVIKQLVGLVTKSNPISDIHSRISVRYGGLVCIKVYSDDNHQPWSSLVL